MSDKIILTDNGQIVLGYMQSHSSTKTFVGKDLGELTGVKGVYRVLDSLIRKSLVVQDEPVIRDFTNSKGETRPHEYKTYTLTAAGKEFSIDM